ncbi:MAG: LamG domain-containing protein [Patescibacteria group bacterium]
MPTRDFERLMAPLWIPNQTVPKLGGNVDFSGVNHLFNDLYSKLTPLVNASGEVVFDVSVTNGDLIPDVDNAYNIGSASYRWKNLYLSGAATLPTVTISGGTISGCDITVGAGKTLNVSAGTLTLADNQISGDKVEGGTIAAITITSATITGFAANTDLGDHNITSLGICYGLDNDLYLNMSADGYTALGADTSILLQSDTITLFDTATETLEYSPAIIAGLLAWWKFNDDATDSSGNGYSLTAYSAPTYVPGVDANAIDLESGSSQYLKSTAAALTFTGDKSIAFWCKPESVSGNERIIHVYSATAAQLVRLAIGSGANLGKLNVTFGATVVVTNAVVFNAGVGVYICVTWDSGTSTITVYVNGVAAATGGATSTFVNTTGFFVGSDATPGNFFDGIIDNLSYWNVVLGLADAQSLAANLSNPEILGSAAQSVFSGKLRINDKLMFTQSDGNEYIDSLADGYLDIGATTAIRLNSGTTFGASTTIDASAAYFTPRRLRQSAQPTPEAGELLVWSDSDDDAVYLVYTDANAGGVKVAMA